MEPETRERCSEMVPPMSHKVLVGSEGRKERKKVKGVACFLTSVSTVEKKVQNEDHVVTSIKRKTNIDARSVLLSCETPKKLLQKLCTNV